MEHSLRSRVTKTRRLVLIVGIVLVLSTVGSLIVQKQISQTEVATVSIQPESKTTAQLVYITGGGATFINPQMQAWIRVFMEKTGGTISINYQSIGSGAGEAKWLEGALDFGASDIAISKTGYERLKESGKRFIQIPIIAGSVALVYNLPRFSEAGCTLRLTGETIADIYLGKIIRWSDPRIVELQEDRCRDFLPDAEIFGIHRSDGSGTTALFTMYLSLVSREWAEKVGYGYTVTWPRDALGLGEGARGNEGVSAKVQATPNSIGYVELAYAIQLKLPVAMLRNRDGYFVYPNATTVMEALRVAAKELPSPQEFWGDLPLKHYINREGRLSYPIVGTPAVFMYVDLPKDLADALYEFFKWVLTEGQKPENIVEGFVPLPEEMRVKALQYLELLKSRG
ncbi:MAG: phosphate ABC transporter substrate-binding protein PstS [Sulfolobales archaeon]